tara:strand:+ start:566 stop:1294 length:729 start_codon:yes stop_codon:yes gene_type:complete
MRIAFSGTGNSGKTTLVKSFLYTWDNYITPKKSYRDIIIEENLPHSSNTTTDTQEKILNFFVEQSQDYDKDAKVVYDRCCLDNIAYTMWCNEKGIEGFDKAYVTSQLALMRESLRFIDIIFLCRFDESQSVQDDGVRDTDVDFIKEVDNIFYSLYRQYTENPEADIFFPKGDSPCIIEMPHDGQERIDLISEYVQTDGDMYGDESSIFNNVNELEKLVHQQKDAFDKEEKEKELYRKFGLGS